MKRHREDDPTKLTPLRLAALVWAELQKRGNTMGRDPRAIEALMSLTFGGAAGRDLPALAELRCDRRGGRGHLLASIHSTRHGQLLWTWPSRQKPPPALRDEAKEILDSIGWDELNLRWINIVLSFRDTLLCGNREQEFRTIHCRCGSNLLDYRELFEAADRAQAVRRTVVVPAVSNRK